MQRKGPMKDFFTSQKEYDPSCSTIMNKKGSEPLFVLHGAAKQRGRKVVGVRRKIQKVLFQVTSDLCTVCNANHHSHLCPSAEENEKKGKNNSAHPSASTMAPFIYFRWMRVKEREREREGEREEGRETERKRERERERERKREREKERERERERKKEKRGARQQEPPSSWTRIDVFCKIVSPPLVETG